MSACDRRPDETFYAGPSNQHFEMDDEVEVLHEGLWNAARIVGIDPELRLLQLEAGPPGDMFDIDVPQDLLAVRLRAPRRRPTLNSFLVHAGAFLEDGQQARTLTPAEREDL